MKRVDIGFGSMTYTVIYQQPNGEIARDIVSGSHDKKAAWMQSKRKFKGILALVPGSHQIIIGS